MATKSEMQEEIDALQISLKAIRGNRKEEIGALNSLLEERAAEISELNDLIAKDAEVNGRLKPLVNELEAKLMAQTNHSNDLEERLSVQVTRTVTLQVAVDYRIAEVDKLNNVILADKYKTMASKAEIDQMHETFTALDVISHLQKVDGLSTKKLLSLSLSSRFAAFLHAQNTGLSL